MGDRPPAGSGADDVNTSNECSQVQCVVIEDPGCFGIGGVVELESPIQGEAVDDVAAHATADGVRRFHDDHVGSVDAHLTCGGEAG